MARPDGMPMIDIPAIRLATLRDLPAIERLIVRSAWGLSNGFYTREQVSAAIRHVFGADSELVRDGTYLVAEQAGDLVACGGSSWRRTLFGGDRCVGRSADRLRPGIDPARIRTFFVDPAHARRGLASALLKASEAAARSAGFTALTLMATLPSVPFYAAAGFRAEPAIDHLAGDTVVPLVPMHKPLIAPALRDQKRDGGST